MDDDLIHRVTHWYTWNTAHWQNHWGSIHAEIPIYNKIFLCFFPPNHSLPLRKKILKTHPITKSYLQILKIPTKSWTPSPIPPKTLASPSTSSTSRITNSTMILLFTFFSTVFINGFFLKGRMRDEHRVKP